MVDSILIMSYTNPPPPPEDKHPAPRSPKPRNPGSHLEKCKSCGLYQCDKDFSQCYNDELVGIEQIWTASYNRQLQPYYSFHDDTFEVHDVRDDWWNKTFSVLRYFYRITTR